jgi:hypothetical protein
MLIIEATRHITAQKERRIIKPKYPKKTQPKIDPIKERPPDSMYKYKAIYSITASNASIQMAIRKFLMQNLV